jgi:hypothetical protein
MTLPRDDMLEILRNGGGLIVGTQGLTADTMIEMARYAGGARARLTFRVNGPLSSERMREIGRNGVRDGASYVTFDVSG